MAESPQPERNELPVDPRREPDSELPAANSAEVSARKLGRTLRSAMTPSVAPMRKGPAVIEELLPPTSEIAPAFAFDLAAPTSSPLSAEQEEAPTMRGDSEPTYVDGASQHEDANPEGDLFGLLGTLQAGVFRIERVVAHGGCSVIYGAHHTGFQAKVALKCLRLPVGLSPEQREAFLKKFESEAQILFRLSSSIPEVVRPLHVGRLLSDTGHEIPFIALEWLDGDSLKTILKSRREQGKAPLSLARSLEFLTPVARALSRAHCLPSKEGTLAVVHCDIKPDNLFLVHSEEGDMFKVLDFGIAKVRDAATRTAGGMTGVEMRMFTPSYAAPEQWDPERFGQTGPWTDVHALALALLEVAAQKPVYGGGPAQVVGACTDPKERPNPSRMGLESHRRLDLAFERALAVDPRARTKTVTEFWSEVEAALGKTPSIVPDSDPALRLPDLTPEVTKAVRKQSFFNLRALTAGEAEPSPPENEPATELAPGTPPQSSIEVSLDSMPLAVAETLEPAAPELAAAEPTAPAALEPAAPGPAAAEVALKAELAARTRLRGVLIVAAASLLLTLIGIVASAAGLETYLQWVGAALLTLTVIVVVIKL